MRTLAILLAVLPAQALLNKMNPVTRVVKLMEQVIGTLEKEKADAENLYESFKCWCDKTRDDIGARIQANKLEKQNIDSQVTELEGMIGRYGQAGETFDTINQGNNGMSYETDEHERNQAKITALTNEKTELEERQTEAETNYNKAETDLTDAIAALTQALTDLGGEDLFNLVQSNAKVRLAIEKGAASLPEQDVEVIDKVMLLTKDKKVSKGKQPGNVNSQFSDDEGYDPKAQKKVYKLIKRIKEQFELQLRQLNSDYWGKADGSLDNHDPDKGEYASYVNLINNKVEEIEAATSALHAGEEEKAAKELKLRDLKATQEALETAITEDDATVTAAETECNAKGELHTAAMTDRAKEISDLQEVVAFLMKPENRDATLAVSDHYGFVQTRTKTRTLKPVRKVVNILEKTAKVSVASNAKVSAKVKAREDYHQLLQDVIDACSEEKIAIQGDMEADRTRLDQDRLDRIQLSTDAKTQALALDAANGAITNAEATIDAENDKLKEYREELQANVDELNGAKKLREEEKLENDNAILEFSEAARVVGEAIQMMKDKGLIPALLQAKAEQPSFGADRTANDKERVEYNPDEAGYSSSQSTETNTIGTVLGMIQQDLLAQKEHVESEEAEAVTQYDAYLADMKARMNAIAKGDGTNGVYETWASSGLTNLQEFNWDNIAEGTYAVAVGKIAEEENEIETQKAARSTANDLMREKTNAIKAMSEDADFLAVNFENRLKMRQTEMAGLDKCVQFLGAAQNEFSLL